MQLGYSPQVYSGQAYDPNYASMQASQAYNLALAQAQHPAARVVQAASAAPITVSVQASPTVQTTVSPQVSPVFQQQYQPTNSPLSAGTSQTSPTSGGQVGASAADIAALLQSQQQAQQASYDNFMKALAAQQAATAAANVAAQQAPAAAAVQPLSSSPAASLDSATAVSGSLDNLPQMSGSPTAPVSSAPQPIIASRPGYDNTMLMLVALGTLAAFMALQPKGKSHGIHRTR